MSWTSEYFRKCLLDALSKMSQIRKFAPSSLENSREVGLIPLNPPSNVVPVIYLEKLITLATDCCYLCTDRRATWGYYHKKKGNAKNHYNSVLFLITVSRTKCTKVWNLNTKISLMSQKRPDYHHTENLAVERIEKSWKIRKITTQN